MLSKFELPATVKMKENRGENFHQEIENRNKNWRSRTPLLNHNFFHMTPFFTTFKCLILHISFCPFLILGRSAEDNLIDGMHTTNWASILQKAETTADVNFLVCSL